MPSPDQEIVFCIKQHYARDFVIDKIEPLGGPKLPTEITAAFGRRSTCHVGMGTTPVANQKPEDGKEPQFVAKSHH
jgi:hypothetical protein